ncbi:MULTISPECIES: phage tail terminator protein [Pseudomonas]|uniref:phage tail terminator protein n=1 Tax=Pseudomonas TaxID=286 RepID=UPI003850D086
MDVGSIVAQISSDLSVSAAVGFIGDSEALSKAPISILPAFYVSPRSNRVTQGPSKDSNNIVVDFFEVLLVLKSPPGKELLAQTQAYNLRADLWRALVGFKPGAEYSPIQYEGGELVPVGNERLLYRLRFFAEFQLGRNRSGQPAETWHERELDGLPSFTGVTVRVDAIDPADPNLKSPGPDGRLELTFSGELKQ